MRCGKCGNGRGTLWKGEGEMGPLSNHRSVSETRPLSLGNSDIKIFAAALNFQMNFYKVEAGVTYMVYVDFMLEKYYLANIDICWICV